MNEITILNKPQRVRFEKLREGDSFELRGDILTKQAIHYRGSKIYDAVRAKDGCVACILDNELVTPVRLRIVADYKTAETTDPAEFSDVEEAEQAAPPTPSTPNRWKLANSLLQKLELARPGEFFTAIAMPELREAREALGISCNSRSIVDNWIAITEKMKQWRAEETQPAKPEDWQYRWFAPPGATTVCGYLVDLANPIELASHDCVLATASDSEPTLPAGYLRLDCLYRHVEDAKAAINARRTPPGTPMACAPPARSSEL